MEAAADDSQLAAVRSPSDRPPWGRHPLVQPRTVVSKSDAQMAKRKPNRKRRTHSDEFKREAVKLLFDQQLLVAKAARNLGIHANLRLSSRDLTLLSERPRFPASSICYLHKNRIPITNTPHGIGGV